MLSQIVATDIGYGTRFHNVLLALLCDKPVISISFHHKCASLMSVMGLSEYCLDINAFQADKLIEKFCELETKLDIIKRSTRAKAMEFRAALDEQYEYIFKDMWSRQSRLRRSDMNRMGGRPSRTSSSLAGLSPGNS